MVAPPQLFVGLWAALATPSRIRRDLDGLLASAPADPRSACADTETTLRIARFALRLLARLPGRTWRNTCLYRSVAECLALRRLGVPARLCLGVDREQAVDSVVAHAWVERGDRDTPDGGPAPSVARLGSAPDCDSASSEPYANRAVRLESARRTEIRSLLEDGALALKYESGLTPLVERWLPRLPSEHPLMHGSTTSRSTISVRVGELPASAEAGREPTLRLGTVRAWVTADADVVVAKGETKACVGHVELEHGRADIRVDEECYVDEDVRAQILPDLYSMLTVSAAMLLGRLGRVLIHAAAVVQPDGTAWLLAGDAGAGKSTTCANLIAAGWDYVSDDQVVLSRGESPRLQAEGWPRDFHLDAGWERGVPTGQRRVVEPSSLGDGRWRRRSLLSGVVLPQVAEERLTEIHPARAADALAALIRQAPWLMADPPVTRRCLELLRSAAGLPAFKLILGRDSFHAPGHLAAVLQAAEK